jgi:SAM-dependent methyltransferase
MPILRTAEIVDILCCPRCKGPLASDSSCSTATCELSQRPFLSCGGQPILVDADDSIIDVAAVEFAIELPGTSAPKILRRLTPRNVVAPRVSKRLALDAAAIAERGRPLILVIGGGTIGSGLEGFYSDPTIDIVSFDIFPSRFTQFVADGHAIPLADASVDGVIVQAVLEHVLEPARVVAEIHRVLRPKGLVYADTPFLQHVHEGAFDFTRFTESGHRWLFRRFSLIESGIVAGIGTELSWSLAHVARSVIPFKGAYSAVRIGMRPIALLVDRLAKPKHAIDGASSFYFYGRRSSETLRPRDMVEHYRGAQAVPKRAT